jgi:uncharacterized protein GlcG (DUF336 family)
MSMEELTLTKAQTVVAAALAHSRQNSFAPMAVAVLDARGALKAFGAEEGTALRRPDIAIGKAYGALSVGLARALWGNGQRSGRTLSRPSPMQSAAR